MTSRVPGNILREQWVTCTLSWFEADVSQSQFARDMAMLEQYEQGQTSQPPHDVVKRFCGLRYLRKLIAI